MQRKHYSHSSHCASAKYSAVSSPRQISHGMGAKALISAGVFVLTIWSVSLFSDNSAHSETVTKISPSQSSAMMGMLPHSDDEPLDLPPLDSTVAYSPMGIYHWQHDCPLANGTSIRHSVTPVVSHRKNQRVLRCEAELQNYYPCLYCAEIKKWRAQYGEAGN